MITIQNRANEDFKGVKGAVVFGILVANTSSTYLDRMIEGFEVLLGHPELW